MKDIFKKPFFIITLAVAIVLSSASLVMRLQNKMSIADNIVGTVMVPFEKANSAIGTFFSGIGQYFRDYNTLKSENEELKKQIKDMKEDVDKAEELQRENDWLYSFLDLKRSEDIYSFKDANVISYSQVSYLASFTVDKGSKDGIEIGMAVITDYGLAGLVTEVGLNFSVCTSTVNPDFSAGVYTERDTTEGEETVTVKTSENLYATGNFNDASESSLRINYLDDNHKIEIGDRVKTTGIGGVYPRGLYIGTVEAIGVDEYSQTLYAEVKAVVDINSASKVMIITDFNGKAAS